MAEQQTKTVIEWLEQAKAHGYEWAQSAIEQVDEDKGKLMDSLSAALKMAFLWSDTKEGWHYWDAIHTELCKQEFEAH